MHALRRIAHFLLEYKLLGLALVAMVVGVVLQLTKLHTALHWVLGTVSIVAVLPIIREMWEDIRTGRYGIDILAVTAIVTAVLLHQYWAAIVIVVMFTGGEALEDYAGHRAKTELDALLARVPTQATVIRKGKTQTVAVSDVHVGDHVILKPGDVVPVDAVITEGTAEFDESSLIGESLPQEKQAGDQLLSGSINIDSAITAKCLRIASESQYEQIIKLMRAASASQAPVIRLADRYSIPFTLAAYTIALAAWFFSHNSIRFLEVIVVATPCPLLIAAPVAIISGVSRAAKRGIIIKTGAALEQLAETRTMAFDKTGTLTTGMLTVDSVTAFAPYTKQTLLGLAAGLEQNSNHVLAQAIVEKAKNSSVKLAKSKHVKELAGRGLSATVSGAEVLIGRFSFMKEHEVELPVKFDKTVIKTKTATYVAVGGKLAGVISFSDTVRPESAETIARIKGYGMQTLMITGDNKSAAQTVAKQLRINQVHAEALPAQKLHLLEAVTDRPVAFVGDGVNDAPVLTASNVGIALGARGSTAASESADMVILLDDISRVADAVDVAKQTFRIARQSIIGGIALSLILMLVFSTGHFPPLLGALLQELVDVIVIFNALRAHGSWKRARQPKEVVATEKLLQGLE
jgi:heavy metal translocating P-type ATPase